MQVFLGIYSVFFFTFILGLIWPHKTEHKFWQSMVGYCLKSLWLSWIVVFISFYTSLGLYMPWLIAGLTIAIIFQQSKCKIPDSHILISINHRFAFGLLVILSVVLIYHLIKNYDLILLCGMRLSHGIGGGWN